MKNTINVKGGARWVVLIPACFLLLSGCHYADSPLSLKSGPVPSLQSAQPVQFVQNGSVPNRASQIEVLATHVVDVPYVSHSKQTRKAAVKTTFPEVIVKWRNNGPEPIGMVRAKIQTWDAKGKALPHSPTTVTIFFARGDARRIKSGQVYDEPVGKGYLVFGPPRPAHAKATIVYADSDAHAYDDIHVGRGIF